MEDLILIGGGGHCKSCIDVIELENKYRIAGIVDLPEKLGQKLLGYSYIATDDDLERLCREYRNFLVTIGQVGIAQKRMRLYDLVKAQGIHFPFVISPKAYVSRHAFIGEGTIIMHQAIVNIGALVGANCIINTNAHIEHDAVIGDHCHVATGAIINGAVRVGKGSFIGSGAVTKQESVIPESTFVKANTIYK